MTDGLGANVVMEVVGFPTTFELCTELVRPRGHVANTGVHGSPVTLHLETLWIKKITTGLFGTSSTPTLLKLVSEGRLDATPFATHRFKLDEMMAACNVFTAAANTNAMKVVISS